MKPIRLLRWYPRKWRERYGEELLALIQDTLDDGRPTWRLQLSVAWGGLRERVHQASNAVRAAVKWLIAPHQSSMLVAGTIIAVLPENLSESPTPAQGWQAAAFDALLAAVALTGAVIVVSGLAALPALVRFLRAGGWPKIRLRRDRAGDSGRNRVVRYRGGGHGEASHARPPAANGPANAGRGESDRGHGHARYPEPLVVSDSVSFVAGRGAALPRPSDPGRPTAATGGLSEGQAAAGRGQRKDEY
jgi:hypothetical protein